MQGKYILLLLTIGSLFSLIVVGAYVAAAGFGDACGSDIPSGWPGCRGGLLPPPQLAPVVEYLHRLLAALSALFLFLTTALFWRGGTSAGPAKRILIAASILLVGQIFFGGAVIVQQQEAVLVTVHQAIAITIFGLAVAAYMTGKRPL